MAITKQKKEEILKEVEKIINDSESIVFVNFHGLGVETANSLRRKLSESQVGYKVVKKSLAKIAFDKSSIKGELPVLEGELAIAWGDDPVVPAGEVYSFQKELDGAVTIIGGVFEGSYKDQVGMTEIAKIPPLDTLRAMFVNVINSPIQRTAIVLSQIAEKKSA